MSSGRLGEMARWEKEPRGTRGLGSDVRIPTQQQRLFVEMDRKQEKCRGVVAFMAARQRT